MRCLKTEKTDPDGTFFEIYPTVRFKAKSGTLFPTQYLIYGYDPPQVLDYHDLVLSDFRRDGC